MLMGKWCFIALNTHYIIYCKKEIIQNEQRIVKTIKAKHPGHVHQLDLVTFLYIKGLSIYILLKSYKKEG